jgi:hypothetical protein
MSSTSHQVCREFAGWRIMIKITVSLYSAVVRGGMRNRSPGIAKQMGAHPSRPQSKNSEFFSFCPSISISKEY